MVHSDHEDHDRDRGGVAEVVADEAAAIEPGREHLAWSCSARPLVITMTSLKTWNAPEIVTMTIRPVISRIKRERDGEEAADGPTPSIDGGLVELARNALDGHGEQQGASSRNPATGS